MDIFMHQKTMLATVAAAMIAAVPASAQDSSFWGWFAGDYSLSLGAAGFAAPSFEGSDELSFYGAPVISISRVGSTQRFSSRNDSASFAILDTGTFRVGPAANLVFGRDADGDLIGLDDVDFGVELGAFAEFYPVEWLRVRGEVRQAIGGHEGLVADLSADAFWDISETVRVSAGPRVSFASEDYFDAFYGVTAAQAVAAPRIINAYAPDGGGLNSIGFGGAVSWKATDRITTSLFAEYWRLQDNAADSSIVKEIGSADQFLFGLSATYRFDFTL
jgi:outer membrane scaffolding protein for murein synthesis (MipA/OmpV family)